MIQCTIFYFNAFSVQLHLAVNDRVQSASACHVVTYYLVSVGILVRLFQYFHLGALATDKQIPLGELTALPQTP